MRFASVVLDVDSTLSGVEGIDWLARLRGPDVAGQVERLTARAMDGAVTLDAVYGERLAIIRPRRDEVDALAQAYRDAIAPGAAESITRLQKADVRVVLVSGGIRRAIEPLARDLHAELHAVDVHWDDHGEYRGFESGSPLVSQTGKEAIVRQLGLPRPVLAVGDGSTDVAMRAAADEFAAFTGFARREAVVRAADREIATFGELATYVLSALPTR